MLIWTIHSELFDLVYHLLDRGFEAINGSDLRVSLVGKQEDPECLVPYGTEF